MKLKRCVLIVCICMLFVGARKTFSGGYEGPGLGSRAISQGGAFIAIADDWTASYWNPAGLINLKKTGIGFTLDLVNTKGKDSNSVANSIVGTPGAVFYKFPIGPTASEPASFNKERISATSYLPGFGFYLPKSFGTLCFSIYEPVGYSMKWDDSVSGVNASYRQSLLIAVINLSFANQITTKLSSGIGINFLQGKNDVYAYKNTTNFKYDMSGKGNGFEGVIGLLFKQNNDLSFGGVYRTGARVDVKGTTTAEGDLTTHTIETSRDFTQKFRQPESMGIGIAYKAIRDVRISLDWQRTNWAALRKEITYDNPGIFTSNKNESFNWKNTDRWRIGTEYSYDSSISIRGGFYVDPLAPTRDSLDITSVVDAGKKGITFGIGYKPSELWYLDFTYLYVGGDEENNNIKYFKHTNALQFGLGYNF